VHPWLGLPHPVQLRCALVQPALGDVPLEERCSLAGGEDESLSAEKGVVEGTVKIGYVGNQPLPNEPPSERVTLITGVTPSGTLAHVDIDEQMCLDWVRQAPGGEPADVAVDISPLRGARRLDIWGTWSPFEMRVVVVDPDQPDRMVTSESSEE
jgi:hypothetical protein